MHVLSIKNLRGNLARIERKIQNGATHVAQKMVATSEKLENNLHVTCTLLMNSACTLCTYFAYIRLFEAFIQA